MRQKPIQVYTVRALDEFGRLYNNSYAFGQFEDLGIEGIASLIMQKLCWPILKQMGEDASAEWDCVLSEFVFKEEDYEREPIRRVLRGTTAV